MGAGLGYRAAAFVLGLAAALVGLESGFRLYFHALPSVDALEDGGFTAASVPQVECPEGRLMAWPPAAVPPGDHNLGVFGDSVAAGVRLDDPLTTRFGVLLARALGTPTDLWAERNEARPGASWCTTVGTAADRIRDGGVDLALVAFFADDLAVHDQLTVNGRPVVFPDRSPPFLRPLVTTSWAANFVWAGWATRVGLADRRFVSRLDQAAFVGAVSGLATLAAANQIPVLFVVLPPIDAGKCVNAASQSMCDWLPRDYGLMRFLLGQAKVESVDLTDVYGDSDVLVPEERDVPVGGMAVHPNALGHARIAARLAPALSGIRARVQ